MNYYAAVERIIQLEYFLHKIGSNLIDVLKMEQCVFKGLPFWSLDLNDEITA